MKEQQRNMVWGSRYHAEMLHRYYGYLSEKMTRRYHRVAFASLLFSSGTVSIIFIDWQQPEALPFCAVITAALNLWMLVSRYYAKAIKSSGLRVKCADWLTECQILWSKVDVLDSDEIETKWRKLEQEGNRITSFADSELGLDNKLRDKSEHEAYDICKVQTA